MRIAAGLFLALIGLAACSPAHPPQGRWEGTIETPDAMIAARLEIEKDGTVYLTAPDAVDVSASGPDDRAAIRLRLAQGLDAAWPSVPALPMEFDGKIFRKPGGVAPQMIWDAAARRMTVLVYPGTRPALRIAMRAVSEFSPDPWPQNP